MILYAMNEHAVLKQARILALPGEKMAVVGDTIPVTQKQHDKTARRGNP